MLRLSRLLHVAPTLVALLLAVPLLPPSPAAALDDALVAARCGDCHTRDAEGRWSRISFQRKSPEGWLMTLTRMELVHGVQLADDERRALVKQLSDELGLAPQETADLRYILEREPNVVEDFDDRMFVEMCARCHSGARVALQRRGLEEWRLLVHQHLGQWPTTEYQLGGRDRHWLEIALEQTAPWLAETWPFDDPAWRAWQAAEKPSLAGRWRVAGHLPGRGPLHGWMTASAAGDDRYEIALELVHADGTTARGTGSALIYSGYEWRASLSLDGIAVKQVLAASADGLTLRGRLFERDADEVGSGLRLVRADAPATSLLAVQPRRLRIGDTAELTLVGAALAGDIDLGPGVVVEQVLSRDAETVVLRARAAADAAAGPRAVAVGAARSPGALTVYRQVDSVRVEPPFGIARVGGGRTPKVTASFVAVGYAAGPDGESGTADDLRIGTLPARWSVEPFDEAAALDDVGFAGRIDPARGIFTPAAAGPNPARLFATNNAGNLKVVATVEDGGRTVTGEGQLVVTVQRWNTPPIR